MFFGQKSDVVILSETQDVILENIVNDILYTKMNMLSSTCQKYVVSDIHTNVKIAKRMIQDRIKIERKLLNLDGRIKLATSGPNTIIVCF